MIKKRILAYILGFIIIFSPFFVTAKGLVPNCGIIVKETQTINGKSVEVSVVKDPCGFDDLMEMINNIIKFVLFTLATPIFALILVYVGFLYISDRGSSKNISKAKTILSNALIGYIIALASWLIVKTIVTSLNYKGDLPLNG